MNGNTAENLTPETVPAAVTLVAKSRPSMIRHACGACGISMLETNTSRPPPARCPSCESKNVPLKAELRSDGPVTVSQAALQATYLANGWKALPKGTEIRESGRQVVLVYRTTWYGVKQPAVSAVAYLPVDKEAEKKRKAEREAAKAAADAAAERIRAEANKGKKDSAAAKAEVKGKKGGKGR